MTVHNATASTFENGQDKRQRKGVMGEPISELRLEDRRYTLFQLRDFEKRAPLTNTNHVHSLGMVRRPSVCQPLSANLCLLKFWSTSESWHFDTPRFGCDTWWLWLVISICVVQVRCSERKWWSNFEFRIKEITFFGQTSVQMKSTIKMTDLDGTVFSPQLILAFWQQDLVSSGMYDIVWPPILWAMSHTAG